MKIGFVGLGSMGSAIAANLIRAGHQVRVWNRSPGPIGELVDLGATAAASVRDALHGDVLFSMLADDAAVRSVFVDGGALQHATTGLIHVNLATVSIRLAGELTELHETLGLRYVAAPVFGRPDAARSGQLNIVAAGDAGALEQLQSLFDVIGQKTWKLGDAPLRANAVKISGNFMIAAAIEAMAEATTLAQAHGVSSAELLDILTSTLFASPVYKGYGTLIAEQRFSSPGFALRLGLKDVRLALEAGDTRHVPLPLASLLRDSLLEAVASGDGELDWAALAKVAQRRAGLDAA